ncbi:hypothetical protein EC973_000726 [Apophysomyces ossiformis]|uniref:SH3 domain-containing protein n=1 Tax=Apophysomyces ossiformis TaxID=679940 RepID=A0A8H7EMZ2_9FUNG|nr:hypothetical protein EC973_000726 [Apophysomyces ossiformis]
MEQNPLDMSLDDVISTKRTSFRREDRGRYSHRGTDRSYHQSRYMTMQPYGARPPRNISYPDQSNTVPSNGLTIYNLHYNVNEDDLHELFGQLGPIRSVHILRKPDGRPTGGATVLFKESKDAVRATQTYNNVELDGRPMRITCGSAIQPSFRGGPMRRPLYNQYNVPTDRHRRPREDIQHQPTQEELDLEMDTYMKMRPSSPDEQDRGVDILSQRLRHGKQTCEEIRKLYEIRAQIEEDYGERLLKLSQLVVGKAEEGSFAESLSHIPSALETTARAHIDLAQQIQHHLESPLNTFIQEQRTLRKTHIQQIENAKQLKNLHSVNVARAKESYMGGVSMIQQLEEQLNADDVTPEDKQKLSSQIEERKMMLNVAGTVRQSLLEMGTDGDEIMVKLDQEYRRAVDVLNEVTTNWVHHWRSTCDVFQNMEEKRMDKLRRGLWAFANMMSSVYTIDDQCCDRIRTSLESADVKKDISAFVEKYKTGGTKPEPRKYSISSRSIPEKKKAKDASSFTSSLNLSHQESNHSTDQSIVNLPPPPPSTTNMTNPDEELKSIEQQLQKLDVNPLSPRTNGCKDEHEPYPLPKESPASPPDNMSYAFREVENMLKERENSALSNDKNVQETLFEENRMKSLPDHTEVAQEALSQEQVQPLQVTQEKNKAPKVRSVSAMYPTTSEVREASRPASVQAKKSSVTGSDQSANELKFKPMPNPHYKGSRSSGIVVPSTETEPKETIQNAAASRQRTSSLPEITVERTEAKQVTDAGDKKEDKLPQRTSSRSEPDTQQITVEPVADHQSENGGSESSYRIPLPPPKDEKWIISSIRRPQQVPVRAQNATVYDGLATTSSRNPTPRTSIIQDSHNTIHVDAAAQLLTQTAKEPEITHPVGKLHRPKIPLTIEIPNSNQQPSQSAPQVAAPREAVMEVTSHSRSISVPKETAIPSWQHESNNNKQIHGGSGQRQPQWNTYNGQDRNTMPAYASNHSLGIRPAPWQEGRLSFDSDLAQQQGVAPSTIFANAPSNSHLRLQLVEQQVDDSKRPKREEEMIPPSRLLNQQLQSSAAEAEAYHSVPEPSKGGKQGKDFGSFMKGVLKPSTDTSQRIETSTGHSKSSSRPGEKPHKDKSAGRFSLGIFGKKEKRVKEADFIIREQQTGTMANAPGEAAIPSNIGPISPQLPRPANIVPAATYSSQEQSYSQSQIRAEEADAQQLQQQQLNVPQEQQQQQQQPPPENFPDNGPPPILHYARAIWSFEATIPSELSFTAGDVMAIIRKQSDGWWVADLAKDPHNPVRGLVPGNYMQVMES